MSLRSVWSNITRGETWLRGVVMLLFVVIYGVTEVLLFAVVLLQFLFTLVTGDQNGRLREFGYSISVFVYQMVRYWTYNSEEKPFPFAPWPGVGK
ncbi:MAG: DUF4389 domain-containing protein [bacterium]|nr:MAG: DUF4389 domain-containing protein [bacterium]